MKSEYIGRVSVPIKYLEITVPKIAYGTLAYEADRSTENAAFAVGFA